MINEDLLARRRAALKDVDRIERDPQSCPVDAPELCGWSVVRSGGSLCLTGRVRGHPRLGDGRRIMTSEVVAIGAELDWARTLNTFYWLKDQS